MRFIDFLYYLIKLSLKKFKTIWNNNDIDIILCSYKKIKQFYLHKIMCIQSWVNYLNCFKLYYLNIDPSRLSIFVAFINTFVVFNKDEINW